MKDTLPNGSASPNQSRVDTLRVWLVRELARVLAISEEALATNEPFSRFGVDSAKAVELLNRLGELLGRKIPVTVAWSHPTIEKLSNYLCGNPDSESEMSPGCLSSVPARNQPIAVIGLACRFPGAPDPETFWEMLRSGRSAIREITPDRWNIEAWYDPDVNKPGKMNARRAGLLECIDQFEPGFFGISPREAVQMDPQQRLALELAWEALEDAGLRPSALRGSRTGVFVGVVWHDYETLAQKAGAETTLHSGTGQAFSIIANRISYALGLQGPSIALDTACSSSLVSVHLACRSLQFGDASLAIAGGVNLIIDPATMVTLSKFGGLSPTSELCAFDARANGFVRGEGGGFVVLKPLSQALADGDPIYAVIRGSATNNDGASNGLTAPNPLAQQAVMREAYVGTGIRTADVQYVEAHGTGTQLGDPIEAQALGDVFGGERPLDQPLLVGSVKTNIGHLEGAAGIAGLIKLILSVKHRSIPPSLNFKIPNPHIDFAKVQVVTGLKPWPETTQPAIGGVSAFGWGGTNCHVVIAEPARSSAQLFPLSAPDTGSLQAIAAELRNYLRANSAKFSLADVCATAAARCARQPERVALTARSLYELGEQLDGFLQGQKRPGLAVGHGVSHRPKLAFIFSPQGSQWIGMGKSLIAAEPVFRTKLVECERAVTKLAGWSLFDLLLSDESRLSGVQFIQPALAAIQIALAELWNSWGVRPDFVAAHSLGEWAAACVAGALTVEETMRIAVESSRVQSQADPGGGMAIVELPREEVVARIREFAQEVFVSGQNSPTSTVVSGDAGRLKSLIADWKNEGLICSLIDVDVAAHSPWMDPVLENLKVSLRGLHPTRTVIPLVSSVLGGPVCGTELGPEHWARHLGQPVLFPQVIEHLSRERSTIFLEISPHPLLLGAIKQTLDVLGLSGVTLSSCRRGVDERESLLSSLGSLYALGWPIEWDAVAHTGRKDLALPIPAASELSVSVGENSATTPWFLPLSGHTLQALRDRARSIAGYLRTNPATSLSDVVHTLGAGREHLEHRLAIVGIDRQALTSSLEGFAQGLDHFDLEIQFGRARSNAEPRIAFVCSGQGPQWWGMGRELLESVPEFHHEIARVAAELRHYSDWDLLEEFSRDESDSRLGDTEIAQPALFALQVALAKVWRSLGIQPNAVLGHSVGEVAAAYLGGILSFEDAVKVIFHRGRLMQRATGLGKMAAIELPEAAIETLLLPYRDRVSIAAVNSPTSVVISGESIAVDEIVSTVKSAGIRHKILPVNYAFHSPQMEPFKTAMVAAVAGLATQGPSIPVYSSVTGFPASGNDFDDLYWGRNIRQTVRFNAAISAMLDAGINTFVELSPDPVMSGMILQCAAESKQKVETLPSLRRGRPEQAQLTKSAAGLFVAGAEIDWSGMHPHGGRVVALPLCPWQKKRFWLDRISGAETKPKAAQTEVPSSWFYEIVWEEKPRSDYPPVLATARQLPSPKTLQTVVEPRLAALQTETRMVRSAEARHDIERLAAYYSTAALLRLGFEFQPARRFTPEGVREELGVQKRHARLFNHIFEMLAEESLLKYCNGAFEIAPFFQNAWSSLLSLGERSESLRGKHAAFATEFGLLARCGEKLADVLRGNIDPLQLLFPIDGVVAAERLYRDSASARFYNRLVGELVFDAVGDTSSSDSVRLLELGAGTGSTTDCILEKLSGVSASYCFTDISRLLLNQASVRFNRFPEVSFALLNIEKPLEANQFEPGSHDLVIGANILHATRDLRASLEHTRELLAPGGLLVLLETTGTRRWLELIFGLTEGWWRFADLDLRPKSPLLGEDQWLALLKECGFTEVASVAADFSTNDPHEQALLLAKVHSPSFGLPRKKSVSAAGAWLIFSDSGQLGEQIAQSLGDHGGECVLVRAGDSFDASNPRELTINLDNPEDYRRLFNPERPWRGVLHSWSLDAVLGDDGEDLITAERLGCRSLLFIVQALLNMEGQQRPKVWLVTRGAQPAWERVASDSIAQAPVWGFGRTLALEHPELWGGIMDIDPDGDPRVLAERISLEICHPDGEDQIAISDKLRLVPRLAAAQPPLTEPIVLRTDASYLITGGLGGLGPQIARSLVEKGARQLILCGRSKLPDRQTWQQLEPSHKFYRQVAAIQDLEQQGATVTIEAVDVGDPAQMKELFERLRHSAMPLRGIVHAAADIKFCALREMTADALHAAMQAKVDGSWLLHKFSEGLPLDFFVLFSSATGLFGANRLGPYAAANQFLDSLAQYRRKKGLPGLSINWGAWDEIRLRETNRDEVGRTTFGLRTMPAELALQAMLLLISEGSPQWMVADVDWELLGEAFAIRGRNKLFERLREKPRREQRVATGQTTATGSSDWVKRLDKTAPEDRRDLLASLVAGETRHVLGLTVDDQLDLDRGLFDLGLDSLMSVQLKGRLEQAVSSVLPTTLTFTYPTVHALTDFLLTEVLKLPSMGSLAMTTRIETEARALGDELADLSDDEIKELLSKELSSLSGDLHR